MRYGSSGELRSKRICTYPHGPEFSAYICNNEIVAMLGIEPSRMGKRKYTKK
jgi:hypothetical protein